MIGVMWVFAIEAGDLPVSVKKAEKSCVRYLSHTLMNCLKCIIY